MLKIGVSAWLKEANSSVPKVLQYFQVNTIANNVMPSKEEANETNDDTQVSTLDSALEVEHLLKNTLQLPIHYR